MLNYDYVYIAINHHNSDSCRLHWDAHKESGRKVIDWNVLLLVAVVSDSDVKTENCSEKFRFVCRMWSHSLNTEIEKSRQPISVTTKTSIMHISFPFLCSFRFRIRWQQQTTNSQLRSSRSFTYKTHLNEKFINRIKKLPFSWGVCSRFRYSFLTHCCSFAFKMCRRFFTSRRWFCISFAFCLSLAIINNLANASISTNLI